MVSIPVFRAINPPQSLNIFRGHIAEVRFSNWEHPHHAPPPEKLGLSRKRIALNPGAAARYAGGLIDPDLFSAPLPTSFWIELTSRCPFDCVFCSRKLLRGSGEHMEFGLFRSLVEQMARPDVVRLNYSGESIHYPYLLEAIALARAAGARTELVTALASIPPPLVEPLASSGLDRLSVSVHTLDPDEFRRIYGFSSMEAMRARLVEFRRASNGRTRLDFAFVAMDRNLAQLGPVAACARQLAVRELYVLPVIRRDPIAEPFLEERTPGFRARLLAAVEAAQASNPGLAVIAGKALSDLPQGAHIRTCEQNPWETVHVLSNGDVVACEVHDRVALGNLARQGLREIWEGGPYREFRRRYFYAEEPKCRACPWAVAHAPQQPEPLSGWYADGWSRQESGLAIEARPGAARIRVRGLLPRASGTLHIECNGRPAATVPSRGGRLRPFDVRFRAPRAAVWRLRFRTASALRPSRAGMAPDDRDLGFALVSAGAAEWMPRAATALRRGLLFPFHALLWTLDRGCRAARRFVHPSEPSPLPYGPGLSVVIPERDNAGLLAECLRALAAAIGRIDEPAEIIVVVNGSPRQDYAALEREFPSVRWLYFGPPRGFSGAARAGVEAARHDWVYLLNNDMLLHPAALEQAMRWRSPRVFAVASRSCPATSAAGARRPTGPVAIFRPMPSRSWS